MRVYDVMKQNTAQTAPTAAAGLCRRERTTSVAHMTGPQPCAGHRTFGWLVLAVVLIASCTVGRCAPTAQSILGEALEAARRARDPQTRALCLARIAAVQANIDKDKYKANLQQAVDFAEGARTQMAVVMALRTVAVRISHVDPQTATTILNQARKRCDELASPVQRTAAYRELMIVASDVSPDLAKQLREQAIEDIANIDQALLRAAALRDLGAALVGSDPQAAKRQFHKARDALAGEGRDAAAYDLARIELAASWARADWPAAKEVIDDIQSSALRSSALVTTAVKLAESDPDSALVAAGGVPVGPARAVIIAAAAAGIEPELVSVSRALAMRARTMAGDTQGGAADTARKYVAIALAASSIEDAIAVAEDISDSLQRDEAFAGVARRIAPQKPTKAAELAGRIGNPVTAESTLAEAAVHLAANDVPQALEIARQLVSRRRRVEALAGIAGTLIPTDGSK